MFQYRFKPLALIPNVWLTSLIALRIAAWPLVWYRVCVLVQKHPLVQAKTLCMYFGLC